MVIGDEIIAIVFGLKLQMLAHGAEKIAYMKLAGQRNQSYENKDQFYALASTAMRRILINYAKQKKTLKRGGDQLRITLADDQVFTSGSMNDLLHLDEAMNKYQTLSDRGSKIIEYWFFSGFSKSFSQKMKSNFPRLR